MTREEAPLLGQFSKAEPEPVQPSDPQVSFVGVVALLLRQKKLIGATTLAITLLATAVVFLLPPSYEAQATILPPQQQQSSLAAFASGSMGGLAGSMGSQLGMKNPGDMYIGILKSRTIGDDIVARFHLKEVYGKRLLSDARKALGKSASFTSGKDSLITILVKDRDPHRAADIANAYVDELHEQNSRLALTDASQRRLFFEQKLNEEKDALANAEIALKATQQSTGLLAPAGQAQVLLMSSAQFRAGIASRLVQLQAMRSYATEENSQMQLLEREIAALQQQLSLVEAKGSGSKLEVSGSRLPEATLEYIRKVRDLKYHETLFELLAKQYEAARIDEAKESPLIQVVDRAVVPDKQSRPSRMLLILGGALAGFALSFAGAFGLENAGGFRQGLQRARSMGSQRSGDQA